MIWDWIGNPRLALSIKPRFYFFFLLDTAQLITKPFIRLIFRVVSNHLLQAKYITYYLFTWSRTHLELWGVIKEIYLLPSSGCFFLWFTSTWKKNKNKNKARAWLDAQRPTIKINPSCKMY